MEEHDNKSESTIEVPSTLDDVINASKIVQPSTLILLLNGIPLAIGVLSMTFLAPKTQDYWCTPKFNMSTVEWRKLNSDIDHHCEYHDINNFNKTTRCDQWTFDTTVYPRTFRSDFTAICDNDWMVKFSDSAIMIGMMIGNFLLSHVSDWYGRKACIVASYLCSLVGGVTSAVAPNFYVFTASRILMAMGFGGGQNGPITLAMESLGSRHRAAISFCDSFGWIAGIMLLPILPMFIKDWRYLAYCLGLTSAPFFIIFLFLDESPRWLLATGRKEQARPVIKRLLKKNGFSNDDHTVNTIVDSTDHMKTAKKSTILSLFKDIRSSVTTMSFLVQYLLTILVYYDMIYFVVSDGDNLYENVWWTGLFEVPCLPTVFVLVKYFRRKTLYFMMYIPSVFATAALYFTHENQLLIRKVLGTIGKMGVQLTISIMGVHINETYITRERGKALGMGITVSRVGAIVSPYANGVNNMLFKSLFNCSACILGLFMALPLRETFNKPLPDEAEDSTENSGHDEENSNVEADNTAGF